MIEEFVPVLLKYSCQFIYNQDILQTHHQKIVSMIIDRQERSLFVIGASIVCFGVTSSVYYWRKYLHCQKQLQKFDKLIIEQKYGSPNFSQIAKNRDKLTEAYFQGPYWGKQFQQQNILKIRKRQTINLFNYEEEEAYNVSGGNFKMSSKQNKIVNVKLQDVTIFTSSLKYNKKEISKFGNSQKIAAQITYSLVGHLYLGMVGTICYNIETSEYDFYPQYMGHSLGQIRNYLSGLSQLNKVMMFFMSAIFVTIGSVMAYPAFKKTLINLYERIWKHQILNENYYRNAVSYSTEPSYQLNCMVCRTNAVQISYECGHVSSCLACHKIQEEKAHGRKYVCPLCKKRSETYERFYFA